MNEASSMTSRFRCLSSLKNLFGREPIRVRPRRLSEGTRPRPEHSPQEGDGSGKLLDPRPAKPEWDSDAGAEPERSPSGARAEPERSPSGARAEPERSR